MPQTSIQRYLPRFACSIALAIPLIGSGPVDATTPAFPLTLDASALAAPEADADAAARPAAKSNRVGFLGLLDSRSVYSMDWFPEPLRADESGLDNEFALSYFHAEHRHAQTDQAFVEIEKSFGMLTLEIGGGYETDRSAAFDPATGRYDCDHEQGFTNIELGARYPLLELVSDDERFDNTVVFGMELSPPTHTQISQDTEFVPKFFDMLKVGDHFSLQLGLGVSTLVGPQAHGLETMEYDAVFGYELTHDVLPLPLVFTTTPMFELDGESTLNQQNAGHDDLTAIIGFRLNFESIGTVQPKLGLGYAFPIDKGGRQDFHWGIAVSMIFEY